MELSQATVMVSKKLMAFSLKPLPHKTICLTTIKTAFIIINRPIKSQLLVGEPKLELTTGLSKTHGGLNGVIKGTLRLR